MKTIELFTVGQSTVYGCSFTRTPRLAKGVLLPGGEVGQVRLTGQADTIFSIPGVATIAGTKIKGFVCQGEESLEFRPNEDQRAKLFEAQQQMEIARCQKMWKEAKS